MPAGAGGSWQQTRITTVGIGLVIVLDMQYISRSVLHGMADSHLLQRPHYEHTPFINIFSTTLTLCHA